jgi:hypothetical protein
LPIGSLGPDRRSGDTEPGSGVTRLGREPAEAVPPDRLFEHLEPFKQRVADDIRTRDDEEAR